MGNSCACCAETIPAARKPSQRVAAQPRRNPLEAANATRCDDKTSSFESSSNGSGYSDENDGSTNGSSGSSNGSSTKDSAASSLPSTTSSSATSSSSPRTSSASPNAAGSFDSDDIFSVESDPQERARRAAESFLQWKDKAYVPLNSEEKRAIKEYRKTVASEEGTYMSTRAQRPRPDGPRREKTREGDYIPLDNPVENVALKRRHSQIRFTEAVAAPVVADVHNEAVFVPLEDGVEIPALRPTASILSKSSMADVVDEVPFFDDMAAMEMEKSDTTSF